MASRTTVLAQLTAELRAHANPAKAKILQRFFKTAPGEYAAGDWFLGVTVPQQRVIARQFRAAPLRDVRRLLHSPWHEERLVALFIMVDQFERGNAAERDRLVQLYLRNTKYVNNWDLVDSSADKLLGEYLYQTKSSFQLLRTLARSRLLWDRRIAMIATFVFIKHGDPSPTLTIAHLLVHDEHDLVQKAVGWMLREVGKRCSQIQANQFLERFAVTMPRIALRYAIEHLPRRRQQYFLQKRYSKT